MKHFFGEKWMYRDDPSLFAHRFFELFLREKSQSTVAGASIQERYPLLE
ncbi:MAG TPA: hypothetical protein PKA81_02975 [Clostridia bacterium]|nr:hypothetical protein [Clostridia bacterium]